MPTKQELHKLIDQLPNELTTSELQALHQAISTVLAAASTPGRGDTRALGRLSSSALLRDWNSDEDSVYDDGPA